MMDKYLIEVPHAGDQASCARAVDAFLASGSHFATNAEWGCKDGEHKAWLIVEVESKEQALRIIPAAYKATAKIIKISKFTREEMDKVATEHHNSY